MDSKKFFFSASSVLCELSRWLKVKNFKKNFLNKKIFACDFIKVRNWNPMEGKSFSYLRVRWEARLAHIEHTFHIHRVNIHTYTHIRAYHTNTHSQHTWDSTYTAVKHFSTPSKRLRERKCFSPPFFFGVCLIYKK